MGNKKRVRFHNRPKVKKIGLLIYLIDKKGHQHYVGQIEFQEQSRLRNPYEYRFILQRYINRHEGRRRPHKGTNTGILFINHRYLHSNYGDN